MLGDIYIMKQVAVIGLGNIGFRHLEGILKCKDDMDVYCVDKMPFDEMRISNTAKKGYKRIKLCSEIENIPTKLDLAVISTTADVRYEVVNELLSFCELKYLILEKILFQREKDYDDIQRIVEEKGIKCWVNCIHPMNHEWKKIYEKVNQEKEFTFSLKGCGWGMACNSIHYLNLIDYLDGTGKVIVDRTEFEPDIMESKRRGFKEVLGVIKGHGDRCKDFSLVCDRNNSPYVIDITTDDEIFSIIEEKEEMIYKSIYSDWREERRKFDSYYVSSATTKIVDDIFSTGNCELPIYERSKDIHLMYIKPLIKFFEEKGFEKGLCPIT